MGTLFTTLYEETAEDHYLLSARTVAQEAVAALWFEGLFRGHPNKPYYEAVDGVGVLLESLIDLDAQSANFTKFGDFDDNGVVDVVDYQTMQDHWLATVSPFEDGDVTGDGFVSLEDFSRFKRDYFEGNPAALGDRFGLVPEPETVWLLLVGLTLVTRRRLPAAICVPLASDPCGACTHRVADPS